MIQIEETIELVKKLKRLEWKIVLHARNILQCQHEAWNIEKELYRRAREAERLVGK